MDSAGYPWAGRTFDHHETAFAGDDGSTPAELREAVDAVRAAGTDPIALARSVGAALVALAQSRLLIPLLAEAGELGVTPEGKTVEKTQELSIVTLAARDGRRVIPAFSSVETMRAWNPEARPIPVPGPQVAIAAAQEGTDLVIIDPGTPEREFGVRRTQLEAMALGQAKVPAWADPTVLRAFAASAKKDPRIVSVELSAGDPEARLLAPEIEVTLQLAAGLDREELAEVVAAAQRRWSEDAAIAENVDSMRLTIRAAEG